MMISCLMPTQAGNELYLREAIQDYIRQSYTNTELVIFHPCDETFSCQLSQVIREFNDSRIRQYSLSADAKNGADMFDAALGDWFCFWSDTSRHYSKRLERQFNFCQKQKADVSFFGEQLHYFMPSKELFWEDWRNANFSQGVIANTMMGKREALLKNNVQCGIDELPEQLSKTDANRSIFSGQGYLHLERYTGQDEAVFQKHGQMAAQTRLGFDDVQLRLPILLETLEDLQLSYPRINLPFDRNQISFVKEGDGWIFADLAYQ